MAVSLLCRKASLKSPGEICVALYENMKMLIPFTNSIFLFSESVTPQGGQRSCFIESTQKYLRIYNDFHHCNGEKECFNKAT